jgi:hypothetical protein
LQRINTPSMLPSAWFHRNNSGNSNTHSVSHGSHTSTASVDTSSIFNSPTQYSDPAQTQALPPEAFSQTKAQQHSVSNSVIPVSDTEQSAPARSSVFSTQTSSSARSVSKYGLSYLLPPPYPYSIMIGQIKFANCLLYSITGTAIILFIPTRRLEANTVQPTSRSR